MRDLFNEDDLESLVQDLLGRWREYNEEQMAEDLELILWVMFRLGWSRGFSDCHIEWDRDRESNSKHATEETS